MNDTIIQPQPKRRVNWVLVWVLGMAGQLCWCLENTWFANYLYVLVGHEGTGPATIVTLMTIFSALATTFSTFFFGTLADRKGRRKPFIVYGYIAWGLFTIVYGLTNLYSSAIVDKLALVGFVIVFTDTIMSFFGSMGNDSGFNAWCSDMLTDKNKGQFGMALAAQPVLGTLIGTLVGGMIVEQEIFIVDKVNNGKGYMLFFAIMGLMVIAMGVLAQFTLKDSPTLKPTVTGGFWKQFASVFNFKKFFKRKELVLVNIAVTVYFIGFNCYFVHIMNWLDFTLRFGAGNGALMLGIPLFIATLCTVPLIPLINKDKAPYIALAAIICAVLGCLVIFFFVVEYGEVPNALLGEIMKNPNTGEEFRRRLFDFKQDWAILLGIMLIGLGYVASIQTYMVWQKRLYPEEQRGQFEGIRILFFVLFPMVAGPLVANPIIKAVSGGESSLPPMELFLAAAIITALAVIPLVFATKYHNKRVAAQAAGESETFQEQIEEAQVQP